MNGKLGFIILAFITVIVGTVLIVDVAQDVGSVTDLRTVVNESVVTGANNTAVAITGQGVSNFVLFWPNSSIIDSTNYTTANRQVVNGVYTATLTTKVIGYNNTQLYFNATVEPDGYLESSSSRAIAPLIVIFFAFGIALVALVPALREEIFKKLGR